MSESARVRSVAVLAELRSALTLYADRVGQALESVDAELRRTQDWLDRQVGCWQAEIRKWEEEAFLAKQELARKRMMRVGDRAPDCSEQEEAVQRAKDRLQCADEKLEVTRNWLRQWATELIEYEGPARLLKSFLEGDLHRAGALLQDKTDILESYLNLSPADDQRGTP